MYNHHAVRRDSPNGGIAQLVEHSVHTRSVICSSQIAATRPVGQEVKTPPFHGGNMGSSPVRVTKKERSESFVLFLSESQGLAYHPVIDFLSVDMTGDEDVCQCLTHIFVPCVALRYIKWKSDRGLGRRCAGRIRHFGRLHRICVLFRNSSIDYAAEERLPMGSSCRSGTKIPH